MVIFSWFKDSFSRLRGCNCAFRDLALQIHFLNCFCTVSNAKSQAILFFRFDDFFGSSPAISLYPSITFRNISFCNIWHWDTNVRFRQCIVLIISNGTGELVLPFVNVSLFVSRLHRVAIVRCPAGPDSVFNAAGFSRALSRKTHAYFARAAAEQQPSESPIPHMALAITTALECTPYTLRSLHLGAVCQNNDGAKKTARGERGEEAARGRANRGDPRAYHVVWSLRVAEDMDLCV